MHGQNESLVKVGFVTYNSSLHFYNVKVTEVLLARLFLANIDLCDVVTEHPNMSDGRNALGIVF